MKWLARAFASAVVRRLAFVLVAFVLAWLGAGTARAEITGPWTCNASLCNDTHDTATDAQAHAMQHVMSEAPAWCDALPENINVKWVFQTAQAEAFGGSSSSGYFHETAWCEDTKPYDGISAPKTWHASNNHRHSYTTNNCASQPDHDDWLYDAVNQVACDAGCYYEGGVDIITGKSVYSPTGAVCTATDDNGGITAPDTDGDGTPDQDDDFPDDPNEDSDSDGDGTGDGGDFAPDDGTNGGDTPGDEDGDDEGDNTSTGGGNCSTPPVSQGDGIAAQIAYQTWATRCAVEALGTAPGGGDGEGDDPGAPGEGVGDVYEGDERTLTEALNEFKTDMENTELSQAVNGFFTGCPTGGSCPAATWEVSDMGINLNLSDFCSGALNDLLDMAGYVVLALAAFAAFRMAFL